MNRTLVWLMLLLVTGCDSGKPGLERVVVHGAVTWHGEPVANGNIRFVPVDRTSGPISGASIADGEYTAAGNGGVPVGSYRIEIEAYRSAEDTGTQGMTDRPPREQFLPAKYNVESLLRLRVDSGTPQMSRDFLME